MIKAIPVMALLAATVAAPALAQDYRYPPESSTTTTTEREESGVREAPDAREESDLDQQAQTPEADREPTGSVETLRNNPSMSAPNVEGEAVPEDPATGVPRPGSGENVERLESTPRP